MATNTTIPSPVVTNDPRFTAGRQLVGQSDCVEIFASLLAQARERFGDSHVETIPGYYEYGNALLRLWQRTNDQESALPPSREAAATAAEERRKQQLEREKPTAESHDTKKPAAAPSTTPESTETEPQDDLTLALEMMETAWSILDETLSQVDDVASPYNTWLLEQRPRVLTGLGDALLELKRPADATDAFLQALQFRQQAKEACDATCPSRSLLQARRRVVEANILVTEALLACPLKRAVVTSETQTTLVPEGEVTSYARGYYDKARDELQEVVVLLGQLKASKEPNMEGEKEDVCYLATMVMAAGETLAKMDDGNDEDETSTTEPQIKKPKL